MDLFVRKKHRMAFVVADDGGLGTLVKQVERVVAHDRHGLQDFAGFGTESYGVIVKTRFFVRGDLTLVGYDPGTDFALPGRHIRDGCVDQHSQ